MMTLTNIDAQPRHKVFSRLDRLIMVMNDKHNGVPLREKKNFLTTIHNSFTGSDFIAWISGRLCNNDNVEALHLATFLLMYGYIYPIDLRTYAVKDEKSFFYKFQSPYYWPTKHLKLSNEKYVIYLLKRSKRNRQKHGLEEHEQNALSKLQIVFSDKMGFMSKQADEQVRVVKEMRRDDKVTHDLQERAFWRVFRPPPGHVKYLEEGPSRCFQPSQMITRKTKNKDLKLKELNYLRQAISKPRMKFSKSLEIFFQRTEQYVQYDPLLNEKAAQPSSPWISDDETMWDINRNLVEVPTEVRIRKWALSFEELLQDETGRNEFEQFLKKEYSQENIRFYKACKELMVCPQSQVSRWKDDIIKEFLTPGAACEVNVDCKTLEMVLQQKADKEVSGKTRYIFQPAVEHVYALMKKDSYTRFLRSDQYKKLLKKSETHYTKKRFFNFGGSNRKKSPSPMVARRRGSASSDGGLMDGEMSGGGYHSYSTGNLRELDDKPKHSLRYSHVASDSSIYMGTYGQSNSPSLRRKTEDVDTRISASKDPRRRSNLEVPRSSYVGGSNDPARKSEALAPCLAISVPRTNVVTPWEGES